LTSYMKRIKRGVFADMALRGMFAYRREEVMRG
jgi:hypothetical protein